MKWAEVHELPCSIARALSVVGDRWTALIVRDAFIGIRRFDELQSNLGISRHRLSDRLGRLIEEGVLEKRLYQSNPPRYEYRLTEKGRDLYPLVLMLRQWGDKWMSGEAGPPSLLKHRPCGHLTNPKLVCSECNEPISPFDMIPLPGPGLTGHSLAASRQDACGQTEATKAAPTKRKPAVKKRPEG